MLRQREELCREVRLSMCLQPLSNAITHLPDDLLYKIACHVAHRDASPRLLRTHNMCYVFRNPVMRVRTFEEMDLV